MAFAPAQRRIRALLGQLAAGADLATPGPAAIPSRFPGCGCVLEAQPCAGSATTTDAAAAAAADLSASHAPVAASLVSEGSRLSGRVAIITGAGSGIGRASAILFAQQGALLLLTDLTAEALEETRRLLLSACPSAASRVALHPADVSLAGSNSTLVSECVRRFGDLHIFFANAGVLGSLAPQIEPEDFARTLAVNVLAVHQGFQAALEHMLTQPASSRRGRVLLATSSVAALRAGAGGVDYSASKAAVINLVQSMASGLTGEGIRVNCLCPGLVETGMTALLFDRARARGTEGKVGQLNPLRRAGAPHEVAAAALFLASDESSYVNGQALVVDGGLSTSHPFVPGGGFTKHK